MSAEVENSSVFPNGQNESTAEVLPRGQSKVTELSLGGLSIKVKTDATPALLRQTRDLVEARFEEYSSKVRGISAHQLAVLVAYTLGEELLQEKERLRILKKKVLESSDGLLSRVETELSELENT